MKFEDLKKGVLYRSDSYQMTGYWDGRDEVSGVVVLTPFEDGSNSRLCHAAALKDLEPAPMLPEGWGKRVRGWDNDKSKAVTGIFCGYTLDGLHRFRVRTESDVEWCKNYEILPAESLHPTIEPEHRESFLEWCRSVGKPVEGAEG